MKTVCFSKILAMAALAVCVSTPMLAGDPPEFSGDGSLMFLTGTVPGHSYLGIGVAEISEERAKVLKLHEAEGVEVSTVTENSPAATAGFQAGDVVLNYNGQKVVGTQQFVRLVQETPAGRTVKVLISRAGKTQTLTATIGTRRGFADTFPWGDRKNIREQQRTFRDQQRALSEQQRALQKRMKELGRINIRISDVPQVFMSWRTSMLGIEAEGIDSQLAEYFGVKTGVLVRSVTKDSPAAKAGLKAGDVITKVNNNAVISPRDITAVIRDGSPENVLHLILMRDRKEMTVTATVKRERPASDPNVELQMLRKKSQDPEL